MKNKEECVLQKTKRTMCVRDFEQTHADAVIRSIVRFTEE